MQNSSSFGRLNVDDPDNAVLPNVYFLDSAHEPLLGRHVVLCDDDEISHGEIRLLLVPLGPGLQSQHVFPGPTLPKHALERRDKSPSLQATEALLVRLSTDVLGVHHGLDSYQHRLELLCA
ncbi:hypothetical protein ACLKA7_005538 [Drosophila subpalustris]